MRNPSQWLVSDVLDDGHNGIITERNEIVLGASSLLTQEQAQRICDIHNAEVKKEGA